MATNEPKVGAGVVIVKDGETLLAQRKGFHGEGMWGSMGGHVEFGENPSETVRREAREELGIELKNVEFLCCVNFMVDGKHYIDVGFTAKIAKGVPTIQTDERDKIERVEWFNLDDLPTPLFPPVECYLKAIKTGEKYFELGNSI